MLQIWEITFEQIRSHPENFDSPEVKECIAPFAHRPNEDSLLLFPSGELVPMTPDELKIFKHNLKHGP